MADTFPTKTQVDTLMDKIKQCRTKWGTSSSSVFTPVAKTTVLNTTDMNNLRTWVDDVKTRSKYPGTLPSAVTKDSVVKDIVTTLTTVSEAIRTYCACNCNHCACNCNRCSCNCNNCSDCNNS